MGVKLEAVLTWVERMARAAEIAVPAIRKIVSVLDTNPKVIMIDNDR